MANREFLIQSAIADLDAGIFSSQRQACRAYNIPESTLRGRRAGQQRHAIAHQQQQRLTPEQEQFLVDWIIDEDLRAHPPSHGRVREMATRILRMNNDHEPLGHLWVTNFLRRNPRVHSVVGRSIEASRAEAATPELIRDFLELFERTRLRLNIPPEAIWNMDETGLALGVCNNSQVIASSHKKKAYKKTPENREWVSIVECVSATGQRLRPAIIFKGKHLQTTWFPLESIPDWFYTSSENGWTSNNVAIEWLNRCFIPESASSLGVNRLLLLDGHGSHSQDDFMIACYMSKIHVLYIPPHSSHILQPLDLAPFSVVKSSYRKQIAALSSLDDAAPIKKQSFILLYDKARRAGLSQSVIQAGWRATGLVPYNPEQVLASSQVQGRPVTPPAAIRPASILDTVITTPQRSQDLYKSRRQLERSESLSRSTRMLIAKAGKAIAMANTRAAKLQLLNTQLQYQVNTTAVTKPRKRIPINQNERFKNIKAIKLAVEAAAIQTAKTVRGLHTTSAATTEIASPNSVFTSMCNKWQM
jgi:hypothetical protein